MPVTPVDFTTVATTGLERSPHAEALAGIRWTHVFYECGLAVDVIYALEPGGKRAVGFKLSQGMDVPDELGAFTFARQRSKLAGEIRGSYFVVKGEY